MQLKLTLSQKGLLLVAVPLLFQIICVSLISFFHLQAELEAARAEHCRKISSDTNRMIRHLMDIVAFTRAEDLSSQGFSLDSYRTAVADIRKDLSDLKNLVKDNPDHLRVVMNSNAAAERTLQMLVDLQAAYKNDDAITLVDKIKKSRKDLRFYVKMIISRELLQLAEQSHMVE